MLPLVTLPSVSRALAYEGVVISMVAPKANATTTTVSGAHRPATLRPRGFRARPPRYLRGPAPVHQEPRVQPFAEALPLLVCGLTLCGGRSPSGDRPFGTFG